MHAVEPNLAYVYLKITDLVTHSVVDDIVLYFTVDYPHQLRKTQFLRKFMISTVDV